MSTVYSSFESSAKTEQQEMPRITSHFMNLYIPLGGKSLALIGFIKGSTLPKRVK